MHYITSKTPLGLNLASLARLYYRFPRLTRDPVWILLVSGLGAEGLEAEEGALLEGSLSLSHQLETMIQTYYIIIITLVLQYLNHSCMHMHVEFV